MRSHQTPFAPRARRLPLALAAACLFTPAGPAALAQVLPQGPNVVRGTADIGINKNLMTIKNSNGAIIDWKSFSIGSGDGVRFDQANASSQVLNRVVGSDPSRILGSLQSNGKVWLLNPHGVLFGKGARVDVAGLVASTLNVDDKDWAAGRYALTNTLRDDSDLRPAKAASSTAA
jgi:filamentous hemagglutinin family protein